MNERDQILDAISVGLVTLDPDLRVRSWNRWMAVHSGLPEEKVVGAPLFEFFPRLENRVFLRNCRSVLRFGNFAFFSQKLHHYLFPFKPPRSLGGQLEQMQQSCVMGPIRGADGAILSLFLVVQDVTELVVQERRLVEMNMRDGLTGVFNRRYLDHRLQVELERFRRYARPLSVVIVDIDHFKRVNDEYGHPCGDEVLRALAASLERSVRKSDVVARYGGEEFCLILPETARAGALTLAEKVRRCVEAQRHAWGGRELSLTISAGVAEAQAGAAGPAELLQRADQALYCAKSGGRNRVEAEPVRS
ncbi:MAG TPA: diguanylate cyclase [Anaeromyxobacter sp.]|nr:diguanylate cyclase [Anaeromyxobacter sp.]